MKDEQPTQIELRPTLLEIDLSAIAENFSMIRDRARGKKVMAVVKANAYGHGLVACARHLLECGADCLGVALLEEGIELRRAGISAPILVFGGIFTSQIRHFIDFDLELTASSVSKLEAIEETAQLLSKRAKVHLKIDTGMERIGVHHDHAETLFRAVLDCKHCEIRGVFSHFATLNEPDYSFASVQLERFLRCRELFQTVCPREQPLFHIGASSAVLRFPEALLDMVRPGIALYGVYPGNSLTESAPLKPAMRLLSKVVYFKVVRKGDGVSYGHTWRAPEDTRVVTIPVGYGDGYSRRLSNKADVLINGKRYPVIGRVCMDQIMVNIGADSAYNGDEVVLLGAQGEEAIRARELAEQIGTSAYEVLTATNTRVPRVYRSHGSGML